MNFIKENNDIIYKSLNTSIKSIINTNDIITGCKKLYERCSKYIYPELLDFIKGISESTKIDYHNLLYINMMVELTEAHCILYNKIIDNKLLHFRTLNFDSPVLNHVITLFKPTDMNTYITINQSCIIGCFTGISSKGLIISECFYNKYLGNNLRSGTPFYFIFHRVLSDCNNIFQAEALIKNSMRNGNLQINISDYKKNHSIIYNYSSFDFSRDKILFDNEIYSSINSELEILEKYKSKIIDINTLIETLQCIKSGKIHTFIYYDKYVYISVFTNKKFSFDNTYYKINLDCLF